MTSVEIASAKVRPTHKLSLVSLCPHAYRHLEIWASRNDRCRCRRRDAQSLWATQNDVYRNHLGQVL